MHIRATMPTSSTLFIPHYDSIVEKNWDTLESGGRLYSAFC